MFHSNLQRVQKRTQVCYTDNCCGDRKFLQEKLGPASVAVEDADHTTCFAEGAGEALPLLQFPTSQGAVLFVVRSENCELSARLCVRLLEAARTSEPAVLGIDVEWSVRPSGPRRQVATLQLSARDGFTVLFHLKPNERKDGIMPKALKELLVNDTVKLVRVFGFIQLAFVPPPIGGSLIASQIPLETSFYVCL